MCMPNDKTELPIDARLRERERPQGPVVMYQRWEELLFLHWQVDPELVQRELPAGLTVDTFGGAAWIGVVPFQMKKVRPRFLPAVGSLSNFPELNLRTYVFDSQGRPGVWFYSLDTPQRMANWIARKFFHLNYRMARFEIKTAPSEPRCAVGIASACADETALVPPGESSIFYKSSLKMADHWDELQEYNWSRVGERFNAAPGSLEFFLVERYRLFAYDRKRGRLWSGQVHHVPYPVQQVELSQYSKRLFSLNQLPVPESAPVSVLASAGVDVSVHPLKLV